MRRSPLVGAVVAAAAVAATTAVLFPLREVAAAISLGVVYLLAVLLVASLWGRWLGVATAVASALAFNYFHIAPTGRFTIADTENWVALGVFLATSLVVSTLAEIARTRTREAEQRRKEADLAAEMARILLKGDDLPGALHVAAERLAAAMGLPSAAIELRPVEGDERRVGFPLRDGERQLGTLLVPAGTPEATLGRLQERVVGQLEALLAAAREREALLADTVETRALRRSDVLKTALLRAVSHDLRTPLTAILAAAQPLGSADLTADERRELAAAVAEEAERLAHLIDQLLDLSRLEADAAAPHRDWCSVDEVLHDAAAEVDRGATFSFAVADDLPLVRADPVQLERAFANLLDNSARHSDGHPVSVRARAVAHRIIVRIVDRGPGIPSAQLERVFEPFYQAGTDRTGHRGSGLGLAIARGFVEVNGGRIWAESLPGQGTSFVVELPLERAPAEVAA